MVPAFPSGGELGQQKENSFVEEKVMYDLEIIIKETLRKATESDFKITKILYNNTSMFKP